jgi:hypothetical protein
MREITEAQRSGPAARDRKKPVSDALSVTVARIVGSRAVIDQSRARVEAAAAQLAARSAEIADWADALRDADPTQRRTDPDGAADVRRAG